MGIFLWVCGIFFSIIIGILVIVALTKSIRALDIYIRKNSPALELPEIKIYDKPIDESYYPNDSFYEEPEENSEDSET